MVVSPRQLNPLTKFDKSWAGKPMAIEDPFKLSHNLASGVGRKMKNFILECFALARLQFGKLHYDIPLNDDLPNIFFNRRCLTPKRFSPNDRTCRNCGEFGHYAKDCHNQRGKAKVQSRQVVTYNQLKKECAPSSLTHTTSTTHQARSHQNVVAPAVCQHFPEGPVSSKQLVVQQVVSTGHPSARGHGSAELMTHPTGSQFQQMADPVCQHFPQQPVTSQQFNVHSVVSMSKPIVCQSAQRQPTATASFSSHSGLQHQASVHQLNSVVSQLSPTVPIPVAVSQQSVPFRGPTHQGSPHPVVSQPNHRNKTVSHQQQQHLKLKDNVKSPVVTPSPSHVPPATIPQDKAVDFGTQYLQSLLGIGMYAPQAQQLAQKSFNYAATTQAVDRTAIQQPSPLTYSSHSSGNGHPLGPVATASSTRQDGLPGPQPWPVNPVEHLKQWEAFYRHQLNVLHCQEQSMKQIKGEPRKQEYLKNIHAWQEYFKKCIEDCHGLQVNSSQVNERSGLPTSPSHTGLPRLPGTSFGQEQ